MDHPPERTAWVRRLFLSLLTASLLLSAVFDRSAGGKPRVSAFPAALVLSDPFLWDALCNSLGVALATALVAILVAVPVGWSLARFRPLFPRLSITVVASLSVVPPICLAWGMKQLRPELQPLFDRLALGSQAHWLELVWVESCWAGAWMVGVTVAGLRQLHPSWEDAALLAGATRRQIAWTLIWPRIRPDVCRTAGLIVLAVLFEPSGPWILEMRRTAAFQLVEAARGGNAGALVSALTILCLASALAIGGIFRLIGGPVKGSDVSGPPGRLSTVALSRRLLVLPPLLMALAAGWLPLAGMIRPLVRPTATPWELSREILRALPWWNSLASTLVLAAVAMIFLQASSRLWNRVFGGTGPSGVPPGIPGDGLPPSFLGALLVFAMVRSGGWLLGAEENISGAGGFTTFDFPYTWRLPGLEPALLVASIWLTIVLSSAVTPLSLRPGVGRRRHPWHENRARWRGEFGLCVSVAGPAFLFASSGRSIAASLAFDGAMVDPTRPAAVFGLLFVGLAIFWRGPRDRSGPGVLAGSGVSGPKSVSPY